MAIFATMSLPYLLVFVGTLLVDLFPFPLPPAFTVMIFLQIKFDLNIWLVLGIGVTGSILGRFLLTLYVPMVAERLFKPSKNEDVQFLGKKLKEKRMKSQFFILIYSLMPLPTTPLFLASGMARLKPIYIIPAFTVGKLISDLAAVLIGRYAAENTQSLLQGVVSWQSILGLILGLVLIFVLLFIDWRALIQHNKFVLKFRIFNSGNKEKAKKNWG